MQIEKGVTYGLILIAIVVFFWAMYYAQAFLIPLTFAALLAMLLAPMSNKLEHWGCSRRWSSFFSTLLMVIVAVGILFLFSARASRFASDLPRLRQQIVQKYQTLRQAAQEQWSIALPRAHHLLAGTALSSIGITVPVLVALVSQGALSVVVGVLVVFAVAQVFESYILEPLVVGSEVDINPLFTIIAVVAGGVLWGIPGLILGIPLLGVTRVLFDRIGPLQPYGYLIGNQQESSRARTVPEKLKSLFGA